MGNLTADRLSVHCYSNRLQMGLQAAKDAGVHLRKLQAEQEQIRVVFASAPSQREFLENLAHEPGVDWKKIHAFHMDEYIGLPKDSKCSFAYFLKTNLFDKVSPASVQYICGIAADPQAECERYSNLLHMNPIDIVFMGIGENGHIAFNDPSVANFLDEKLVKVVSLEEVCRQQQVNDGCFPSIEDVPKKAITLTIPALFSARRLFCIVPSRTKAQAVRDTLKGPIGESCPASILRMHADASLYLDAESAELL